MTPLEVTKAFVGCINAHDVDGIVAHMTEDHRFVDSLGQAVVGREPMGAGWRSYFGMVPDYRLAAESWLCEGFTVVMIGTAGGTYVPDGVRRPERECSYPAVCYARVSRQLVEEWRVYADNEPMRALMRVHV